MKRTNRQSTIRPVRSTVKDATVIPTATVTLSAKTQHLIDEVKGDFGEYCTEFSLAMKTRSDIAPKFMKTYEAFKADTDGGQFITFVHEMHWDAKFATRLQSLSQKLGPVQTSSRSALRLQRSSEKRTGTHG